MRPARWQCLALRPACEGRGGAVPAGNRKAPNALRAANEFRDSTFVPVPPASWAPRGPPSDRRAVTPTDRRAFRAARRRRGSQTGQSLTEFALVVPILLVLFVAIADFGRIFAAAIDLEAATRDAAEATANEYLSNPPGPLDAPATAPQPYYDALHDLGASVVCAEMRGLPNTNYDSGTNTCPGIPYVIVCVHDGNDPGCGSPAQAGHGGIPSNCGDFTPAANSSQDGTLNRWVEVRTCYQFTAILNNMPLFPFNEIWLQRTRNFTIPCYFVLGTAECG